MKNEVRVRSRCMQKCMDDNRNLVVGYITAGYPDQEGFFRMIHELCSRGLPVLEIGFPSKNPYEDGEVIRKAHKKVGTGLCKDMNFWRRLRMEVSVPIWLMGYKNDLVDTGIYRGLAERGLFDALVIPDMDIGDRMRLKEEMDGLQVDVVGFISGHDSFQDITKTFQEFPIIYQRLHSGPTGVETIGSDYENLLDYSKLFHRNAVFAGFGIRSGDRVRELIQGGFYGAVVGTEIMRKLDSSRDELFNFIEDLARVVKEESAQ